MPLGEGDSGIKLFNIISFCFFDFNHTLPISKCIQANCKIHSQCDKGVVGDLL
jgi:hypothetical protein